MIYCHLYSRALRTPFTLAAAATTITTAWHKWLCSRFLSRKNEIFQKNIFHDATTCDHQIKQHKWYREQNARKQKHIILIHKENDEKCIDKCMENYHLKKVKRECNLKCWMKIVCTKKFVCLLSCQKSKMFILTVLDLQTMALNRQYITMQKISAGIYNWNSV